MQALEELEKSVIGAVILRPDNLAVLPALEPGDFEAFRSRATFAAIRNLEARHSPIDVVTIGDELAKAGKLEAVGWDYLGECALRVPTVENAVEYARLVRDGGLKRRVLEALAEAIEMGRGDESTGSGVLSAALAGIARLSAEQPSESCAIGDVVKRRVKQLEIIAEERSRGRLTLTGFPTGVEALDEKLGGWQAGIVSIVAARPAMGKSSLGLATADACSSSGSGVHLFSLEDTEGSYADRVLSRTSQVPAENLRNSTLTRSQMTEVGMAISKLARRPGWLVDSRSGITADEIVREVRRKLRDNGTRVVIVDYVQLVKRPQRVNAHEALSEIVTAFADAAKQDGIAYVVMSQLNRELEKRDDKRPQLSDLRESGSLEERAKCVVGIYRGSVYGKPRKGVDYRDDEFAPSDDEFARHVQLLVLKNSNGRTGVVRAKWTGPTTRIE